MKKTLYYMMITLTVIGAINWGLVGVFNFDLVAAIFGPMTIVSRIIYTLVAIAGVGLLFSMKCLSKACEIPDEDITHDVAPKQIINPASPSKKEQEKMIAEGGDSQPLK